jgi:hypothetical protein
VKRIALPLAVLALALLCSAPGASAATPPENIPLGSEPSSCSSEASAECERWAIERLDAARADLGLAAYALPSDFTGLSPDRQLLILTDLDRIAYGYTPVYGLNTNLSEAAQAGVREGRDPTTPSAGGPWKGFGSDWASTGALIGYYLWMYDDGYGSPNGDCTSPDAPGCWGHRKVILGEAVSLPQPQLMGAAAGSAARNAGSALIISGNATTNAYYTWAQAQKEGAGGSGEEPPAVVPPEAPAREEPAAPSTPPSSGPTASTQAGNPPPSSPGTLPPSEVLAASAAPTEQIAVLLGDHLLPSGRGARIAAVLKRGGITLTLPAGLRGTLVVDCFAGSTRRFLVAKGSRHLSGDTETVAVTLTHAGRHILGRRGRVALIAVARLVPVAGPTINVSKPLVLTR